ncbi:MerR family transcriptional regulator [Paraburkholderia sp. 1N]|uniref:MerR family transcriptional regulator n=1 Tax=Paraburkholderia solitsugae TaxID=2675748 RepID=A0ABX2C053_9BURK|nr:MerR family transcriptional regulator [Paraburkholderia solitsugae]NPT45563.1 MerR family transcriptional regulator [Paraburkholderia solitsugae]
MRCFTAFLSASEAAKQLGVSIKALRLYEQRGLVTPERTAAGYRSYGPTEMVRAAEIVALRALGLSLAQVEQVLEGDPQSLEPALAAHEATLEAGIRQLVNTIAKVRGLRADLARGQAPADGELARLLNPSAEFSTAFELPWPWGGERFELRAIRPLNYIIGPLGSGKTRLALCLAEKLPKAAFLSLERIHDGHAVTVARLETDPALKSRVDQALAWLIDEGAAESEALTALLVGLESEGPAVLVVDMVEQGLDQATQEALIIHLRQRAKVAGRPLFLMTRSSTILDLAAIGPDEAIILCPANHSPPTLVAPYPGTPGYEAVATCLASPEVRARTAGMIAYRSQAA